MPVYSADVLEIVKTATEAHPDDIPAAVERCLADLKAWTGYKSLVQKLVYQAVKELVYQHRHTTNTATKKASGGYHTRPQVNRANSRTVQEVYEELYGYYIAGQTLGSMTRQQLLDTAASEAEIAKGYEFNATLCAELARRVPETGTVRSSVSGPTLRSLFDKLQNQPVRA